MPLLVRNRNYRLLLTAGTLTNLGDGVIVLALPWLATLMSRDPLAIAAVAAAGSMPWLLFALPSGVIIDRTDRRKLIARADMIRAGIVIAIMMLALSEPVAGAVWLLAGPRLCSRLCRGNAGQRCSNNFAVYCRTSRSGGCQWSDVERRATNGPVHCPPARRRTDRAGYRGAFWPGCRSASACSRHGLAHYIATSTDELCAVLARFG